MVVINLQRQLQRATFEHAAHYLIKHKLDLSVFHPKYCNDDIGRTAYALAILLNIVLFNTSKLNTFLSAYSSYLILNLRRLIIMHFYYQGFTDFDELD
jgi:hypothetical protein